MAFASGLASQNLGQYTNRLMGLTQLGSNTQQYLGQLGQNYGNQYANAMGIKGQANGMVASAGAGAQAGYGNALAAGAGAYLGAGGGGGGGGLSGFMGSTGGTQQGSMSGFGNNLPNFMAMGRNSSWGG
jgi:hypothetical protein